MAKRPNAILPLLSAKITRPCLPQRRSGCASAPQPCFLLKRRSSGEANKHTRFYRAKRNKDIVALPGQSSSSMSLAREKLVNLPRAICANQAWSIGVEPPTDAGAEPSRVIESGGRINSLMKVSCCSQHRCASLACAVCARRYAARAAKQIAGEHCCGLFALEIDADLSGVSDFWRWCVAARNRLDYLRRQDRGWRTVGISVWLGSDNSVRGVIGLEGMAPDFFVAAFARWSVTLRPIGPSDLRAEITAATRPEMIARGLALEGRYQRLTLSIRPARSSREPRRLVRRTRSVRGELAPMPVVL